MRCEFCTLAEPQQGTHWFCPIFNHLFNINPDRECTVSLKKSRLILKLENVSYNASSLAGKATITIEEIEHEKYSSEVTITDADDDTQLATLFLTDKERITFASHLVFHATEEEQSLDTMVSEVENDA